MLGDIGVDHHFVVHRQLDVVTDALLLHPHDGVGQDVVRRPLTGVVHALVRPLVGDRQDSSAHGDHPAVGFRHSGHLGHPLRALGHGCEQLPSELGSGLGGVAQHFGEGPDRLAVHGRQQDDLRGAASFFVHRQTTCTLDGFVEIRTRLERGQELAVLGHQGHGHRFDLAPVDRGQALSVVRDDRPRQLGELVVLGPGDAHSTGLAGT